MEESYPVLEKPMTDHQWKSVTLGIGDGILDEGGRPYWFSLDNATNQVTITVDGTKGYNHAILKGFYHRMDKEIVLDLPPVRESTTYQVALQYDPTRIDIPVKLGVFTELDFSGSKEYLVIHKFTREPNQLLTDSHHVLQRPTITPCILVERQENLPDNPLWGTLAHCWKDNVIVRAGLNKKWHPVTPFTVTPRAMPGWGMEYTTGGILVTPITGGFMCRMAGTMQRRADSYQTRGWHSAGSPVPDDWAPPQYNVIHSIHYDSQRHYSIASRLTESGLAHTGISGDIFIAQGSNITFDFNWFIKREGSV